MVVDATVSTVLTRLAPIIEKWIQDEVCLLINSTDEATKLSSNLQKIKQVLIDAERKGVTDPKVRSWLDKLQDISYDIDDELDELEWEIMRIQLEDVFESSSESDPWQKVCSFIESLCLCFRNVVDRRKVNLNIKHLNERLDLIGKENDDEFKFVPNLSRNSENIRRLVNETTSRVEVNKICGRDGDKEILISKLLGERSTETKNEIPIISVVGAGGMGKTTLARLVFNDQIIKANFKVKIWVCVSDPFDEIKIAKAILETVIGSAPHLSRFEGFLERIKIEVSRKRFLLVLDDVWTEDDNMWEPLRICLNKGAPNSRILVTTRKMKVAQVMGSSQDQIQSLNPITDSDCWAILSEIAFRERTYQEREILNDIGLEIVKKCKGLPLAAMVMGSLLRFKSNGYQWREVLNSQMWELEKVRKGIFPFLLLSYDELDPIAKCCFSYCSIFPKDTWLDVEELIRIWCAQGFLSSIGNSLDDMEVKGREIFDDLAMRSFFQDFQKAYLGSRIVSCKMHDITHDFAQFLRENECLIVENVDGGVKSSVIQNARHINMLESKNEADIIPISQLNEKCRSFLTSGNVVPRNLFSRLKRVRVLILKSCELEVIPREIGFSIHLRLLDLSCNRINELPEDICNLYNLETLILSRCNNLCGLPQGIRKLRKLRHLINEDTRIEFPEGTEELTNLQTLSEINARPRRNWKNLGMLRNMSRLGGSLRILVGVDDSDDEEEELVETAEKANLSNKNLLLSLILRCDGKVSIQVVEALQPHSNLEVLDYKGPYLPKWLATLTTLRELTIRGSYSTILPPLGKLMPFLELLSVNMMFGMKVVKHELLGIDDTHTTTTEPTKLCASFPSLRELTFFHCSQWEEWEDISEEEENNINLSLFPSLQTLAFLVCSKLKALPHRLLRKVSSLKELVIISCEKLGERYKDWEGASQIHNISHLPNPWL